MKLRIAFAKFNKLQNRVTFASALATLLRQEADFTPEKPNATDDRYYVVDRDNNWRLTFVEGSDTDIVISYRYQCPAVPREEQLYTELCKHLVSYQENIN